VNRENAWEISTNNSAGGYAHLFPEPIEKKGKDLQVTWSWSTQVFPKINSKNLFQKDGDDFPLRIGVLLSGGGSEISVPMDLKKTLDSRNYRVSHIMFYSAAQLDQKSPIEGKSPYSSKIAYQLIPNSDASQLTAVNPFADVKRLFKFDSEKLESLKIIGLWIFADSDNSRSSSLATLENLRTVFE